jgi:hypothetical protein
MLTTRSQSTEPPSHRITQLLIPQNKWILALQVPDSWFLEYAYLDFQYVLYRKIR